MALRLLTGLGTTRRVFALRGSGVYPPSLVWCCIAQGRPGFAGVAARFWGLPAVAVVFGAERCLGSTQLPLSLLLSSHGLGDDPPISLAWQPPRQASTIASTAGAAASLFSLPGRLDTSTSFAQSLLSRQSARQPARQPHSLFPDRPPPSTYSLHLLLSTQLPTMPTATFLPPTTPTSKTYLTALANLQQLLLLVDLPTSTA